MKILLAGVLRIIAAIALGVSKVVTGLFLYPFLLIHDFLVDVISVLEGVPHEDD